ncbi:MAG: hypothetical protein MK217_05225 [Gammaproteobacteria bacterium]|nr:hypothetical protein [Gammaproteobacteria bacterium]
MKQAVNQYQFEQAFRDCGRFGGDNDNFSYEALKLLFEWFEQYEEDCGTEVELDPIAICCDFAELTYSEIARDYDCDDVLMILQREQENIEDIEPEAVAEFLNERTLYVGMTEPSEYSKLAEPTFVFQSF